MAGVDVTIPHSLEKIKAMRAMMFSMAEDAPDVVDAKFSETIKQIWSNIGGAPV